MSRVIVLPLQPPVETPVKATEVTLTCTACGTHTRAALDGGRVPSQAWICGNTKCKPLHKPA